MYTTEGDDQLSAPTKEQLDQEKQLLLAFKPVMQKFLHEHVDLQVSALYALQVHCNTHAFPKGTAKNLLTVYYDNYPRLGGMHVCLYLLIPFFFKLK